MANAKRRTGRPWKAPTTPHVQLVAVVSAATKLAVRARALASGKTQAEAAADLIRRGLRLPERAEP
jgi:hypothetical protein